MKNDLVKGFSLLEMMVVLTVFSILIIISTQVIISTVKLANKSKSISRVRGDLDFALSTIERQLRNVSEVNPCPNPDTSTISVVDNLGSPTSFSCINVGEAAGYIASGSARLTSTDVSITACTIECTAGSGSSLPSVRINVTGKEANLSTLEGAEVEMSTSIYLRTY